MMNILLSTYNGAPYLPELLASLEAQTFQDWQLLVRDDGSIDETVRILRTFQQKYPDKIIFLEDNNGNLGSYQSYMRLLKSADSAYVIFADQDDVWKPNKIELSLQKMQDLEKLHGKNIPLLVFTDLSVMDAKLNLLHESFWQYQKLDPKISQNWKKLLAQNVITGCTMLSNQAGKQVCLPAILEKHILPDHWIGVQIAKYGHIGYINESTILYRTHTQNVAGSHKFGYLYILKKLFTIKNNFNNFRQFARYYQEVSVWELIYLKIMLNLKRIV